MKIRHQQTDIHGMQYNQPHKTQSARGRASYNIASFVWEICLCGSGAPAAIGLRKTQSARGRASYNTTRLCGAVLLWERRPRRDWHSPNPNRPGGGPPTTSHPNPIGPGAGLLQHHPSVWGCAFVGAAPPPRLVFPSTLVGAAPPPRLAIANPSARGRASNNTSPNALRPSKSPSPRAR